MNKESREVESETIQVGSYEVRYSDVHVCVPTNPHEAHYTDLREGLWSASLTRNGRGLVTSVLLVRDGTNLGELEWDPGNELYDDRVYVRQCVWRSMNLRVDAPEHPDEVWLEELEPVLEGPLGYGIVRGTVAVRLGARCTIQSEQGLLPGTLDMDERKALAVRVTMDYSRSCPLDVARGPEREEEEE